MNHFKGKLMQERGGSEFLRGATLTSTGALLGTFVDFCAFVLVARNVSTTDFGWFMLFLLAGKFALTVADFGVRQTAVHFLSTQNGEDQIFRVLFTVQTIAGLLVAGLSLLVCQLAESVFRAQSLPPGFTSYLAILVVLQTWHQLFAGALQGLRRYRGFVAGELTRSLARLLLMCIVVYRMDRGVPGLMMSAVAGVGVATGVQWLLIPLSKWPLFDLVLWRRLFRFAFPLGINALVGMTFDRFSRFILAASAGPVGVALLETSSRIPDASLLTYQGFQSVFFPTMSRLSASDKEQSGRFLNQTLAILSFTIAVIAAVACGLRRQIVVLLFSATYASTAWAFALLTAALLVAVSNNLLHTTLIASGNSRSALYSGVFQCAVNLTLCFLLIPSGGYLGAVAACIGGNLAVNPLLVYLLRRERINVRVSTYLKPGGLLLVVLAEALLIQSGWGFAIAASLTLLLGCAVLDGLDRGDLRLLRGALSSEAYSAAVGAANH